MHISVYSASSQEFIMCFFSHNIHVAEQLEPKFCVLIDGINNRSGYFNHMGNLYQVLNKPKTE